MLIGIDGNEANVENRVGVGEYSYELLMQFSIFNFQFSIKTKNINFQIYLKSKPLSDLPKQNDRWNYRIVRPRKLWTQIGLPIDLYFHKPRPDVFFTPSHYAPRFSPIPTVISAMDLSYIHFPELFRKQDLYQLRNWTAYSVRNAKKILTISQASKNDIIQVYKVPDDKVVVTYPGIKLKSQMSKLKTTSQNSKVLNDKYGIEEEYILFVGTLQPRKNIIRLIEAFSTLICHPERSEGSLAKQERDSSPSAQNDIRNNIELIIVGKKGWLYEEILSAPKKFGVEDKVKFLDFVSDEDLPLFYQNAICFVLPSLYEGFGLPVLEAMKYGCPVITSNVSSLPEAGGEAALYVDPQDTDDIAKKIKMVINDEKLRKQMIEKGYKQIKKFSWEKTARETLSVLEEVART